MVDRECPPIIVGSGPYVARTGSREAVTPKILFRILPLCGEMLTLRSG